MDLEEAIEDYFRANPGGITAVYLFGSRASGNCTSGSDVDIAVLFAGSDPDMRAAIMAKFQLDLSRRLRRDVHLVTLNSAGEALLKQVFSKGRCLMVTDTRKHAEFKMTAYARIVGYGYYLKRMQAGLIRRIMEANAHG
jgi:predicted nucleotidyltransferase